MVLCLLKMSGTILSKESNESVGMQEIPTASGSLRKTLSGTLWAGDNPSLDGFGIPFLLLFLMLLSESKRVSPSGYREPVRVNLGGI
jgi:hypothetical protein